MENATKALMIAGAVLIAIMIIGVGMMIFNSGSKTINDSIGKLGQMEKQAHNSEFESYQDKQKGSTVKELISKIIAYNSENEIAHPEKVVEVLDDVDDAATATAKGVTGSNELSTLRNSIINGKTYNITFAYTDGLVKKIGIKLVEAKAGGAGQQGN